MHDDVSLALPQRERKPVGVPNIGFDIDVEQITNPRHVVERRRRWRGEGVAGDLRPESVQHQGKPRPLEARVSRHENTFAPQACHLGCHQTFHGAAPCFHISFAYR